MEGESFKGESILGSFDQKAETQVVECIKLESEESEECFGECESLIWSEPNSTGNILNRIIRDPERKRQPTLGKWVHHKILKNLKAEKEINEHQYHASKQLTPLDQMCCLRVTSDPHSYRQPAIIGTIGPSSTLPAEILELLEAGMNIARVNMAHINPCSKTEYLQSVIEASNRFCAQKDYGIPIGIMMDLKGPEIRTGMLDPARFRNPKKTDVILEDCNSVCLTTDKIFQNHCDEKTIYVDYPPLALQLKPEMVLYISHGAIKLRVESTETTSVTCKIEKGGILKSYQIVNIPMLPLSLPTISNYDIECLDLAIEQNVDMVVVSRVRNDSTIKCVKKILGEKKEDHGILVLAKISTYEGLRNINRILNVADGIVIHRNDLALEISPSKVFIAQKEIIGKCNKVGKPVICTAQLSKNGRTELSDIGYCIIDGADGILLSEETAVGYDGPKIINQLSEICREAEAATMQSPYFLNLVDAQKPSLEPVHAMAIAAVQIANKIEAACILAITTSGKTAQLMSWYRPRCPVIAITRIGTTARQLNLWRCVQPLHYTGPVLPDWYHDVTARFEYGISYGRDMGIIQSGDPLILVSGYRQQSGFTNCLRVVFASTEDGNFLSNLNQYYEPSIK